MLVRRPFTSQIPPLLRPLRPPSLLAHPDRPRPRLFTQKHPLLLLTRTSTPRPQLPYLSQPSRNLPAGPALQRQLARLLTTETRRYVRDQTFLALKWSAVLWASVVLLSFAWYGWMCELVEREHPSPAEWRYVTRSAFRAAYMKMSPNYDGTGVIDWAQVAACFKQCVERLESPALDGSGLVSAGDAEGMDGPLLIPEVGRAGFDVSAKSYPWRAGYFEVLMGCAQAAEYLDDMVADTTRMKTFPKDVVIGPSNPYPKPTPPNMLEAPLEENCIPAFDAPETYYVRILTTKGFSTQQRLDAALAYANWLTFKNTPAAAEAVYRWAIDIAASALDVDATLCIDRASGVLSDFGSATASPNLLRAATSLGTHLARTGDPSSALPIYLSVLRARRSAPLDPTISVTDPSTRSDAITAAQKRNATDFGAVVSFFRSLIRSSAYPPEPESGDAPLLRTRIQAADCANAELMLYVGEILFATSTGSGAERGRVDGVGWTRQAVESAERAVRDSGLTRAERGQCKACLETGVANWGAMVKKLAKEELAGKAREGQGAAAGGWKSWFGGGGAWAKETEGPTLGRWEQEAAVVEALRLKLVREGITEQMAASGGVPGGVWIG